MRNLSHLKEFRVSLFGKAEDDYNGAFKIKIDDVEFFIIASNTNQWDHLSISFKERCPRTDEIQQIKELFFGDLEIVMQLYPKKELYLNPESRCVHLWRPQKEVIPQPPKYMI